MNLLGASNSRSRKVRAHRGGNGAARPAARRVSLEGGSLNAEFAGDLVGLFKLLADETRLRIVHHLLHNDEIHVRAFCDLLGQSQPGVSHHLSLLREAGLIGVRRAGKHNFYHLLSSGFRRFLDRLFAAIPESDRRIRFEEYVLSYSPPQDSTTL